MIHALFGNQNVERILLFLFVNERCYGTQLSTLLEVPLTPIQNALNRLERCGILKSYFEGSRVYQFDSASALRWELEMLLKKIYTLLPPPEKKRYCFIHKPKTSAVLEKNRERNRRKELSLFWEKLLKIEKLSLVTKSRRDQESVTQTGKAEITSLLIAPTVLIFQEKGYWYVDGHPHSKFSSAFRWTLDLKASLITLEHLRHGNNHPVFLFHLTPQLPNKLESVDAHLCGQDTYLGSLSWDLDQIFFHWRIIGPQKNDELIYHYS